MSSQKPKRVEGGSVITPKEISDILMERLPNLKHVPERDRNIIAYYAIHLPPQRIAAMMGIPVSEVNESVSRYGAVVKDVDESIRMKILRMVVWRFAATSVSFLMEASMGKGMSIDSAIRNLDRVPGIMEKLAQTEKTLMTAEKQHKEIDFDGFGKSLGK